MVLVLTTLKIKKKTVHGCSLSCKWITYGTSYLHVSKEVKWNRCFLLWVSCKDEDSSVWQNLADMHWTMIHHFVVEADQSDKINTQPVHWNTSECFYQQRFLWLRLCDLIGCCCGWKLFCLSVSTGSGGSVETSQAQAAAGTGSEGVVEGGQAAPSGSSIVRWPREETASCCRPHTNFPLAEASLCRCLGQVTHHGLTLVFGVSHRTNRGAENICVTSDPPQISSDPLRSIYIIE